MKRVKIENIKNSHGATNWSELRKKTDSDIEKEAKNSNDAKLLTEVELTQLRRTSNEQGDQ